MTADDESRAILFDSAQVLSGRTIVYTPLGGSAIPGVLAVRKQLVTTTQAPFDVMVADYDTEWLVPQAQVTARPGRGDTIANGADVYDVSEPAAADVDRAVWVCHCKKRD